MCARYYIDNRIYGELEKFVGDMKENLSSAHGSKDLYPSQIAPILLQENDQLSLHYMNWGFPGSRSGDLIINARAETLLERSLFRDSALSRRCVIPARSFYEWNAKKEKATLSRPNHSTLYLAGIYNIFKNENRFTIITTAANQSVQSIHTRMPLILESHELEQWLFGSSFPSDLLTKVPDALENRYDYEQLSLFDISTQSF